MTVLIAIAAHLANYRRIDVRAFDSVDEGAGMNIDGGSQYSGCFFPAAGVGVGEGVAATCA